MPPALQSALGILVLLVLAWAFSENRTRLPWRILLSGLALQLAFAGTLLWMPAFKGVLIGLNDLLLSLEEATRAAVNCLLRRVAAARVSSSPSAPCR
jgi:CNT family concentrative nucleoside transporter